jgi:hypothetical protein
MAKYLVHEAGLAHARELIEARRYVLRSEWGRVQPSAEEENAYLARHSWPEYGAWHLALTDGAGEETKARYAFVYGDFRRVHRMGIIARPRPGTRPELARGGEDEVLRLLQLLDATRA